MICLEMQKDSHRSTECVNLDCPGFQLVKGSPISPGDIISPVSGINRKRQTITIKVYKVRLLSFNSLGMQKWSLNYCPICLHE